MAPPAADARRPLAGRRALVTGGGDGIGLATAQALWQAGARVSVADVRKPPADATFDAHEADVARAADVQRLFDALHAADALPDVLVLAAGVGVHERLDEGDPEKWARVLDVNVMGALRVLRAMLPAMLARPEGSDVVFLSSVSAMRGYPYGAAYAASKAALESIADTLRLEAHGRARVLSVMPGIVDTAFFSRAPGHPADLDAIGWGALRPSEVADAIVFALARPRETSVSRILVHPTKQPL